MEWMDKVHIYFVSGTVPSEPDNLIYLYQTLISGALAVLAAGFTIWFIRKQVQATEKQHAETIAELKLQIRVAEDQIRSSEKVHRELLERRHRATRSSLPLSLSDLFDYATDCIDCLAEAMANCGEHEDIRKSIDGPELPRKAIANLVDVIEASSTEDAVQLQHLLRFVQLQNARIRKCLYQIGPDRREGDGVHKFNLRPVVLDCYVLLAMISHVFPFARKERDKIGKYRTKASEIPHNFFLEEKFDNLTVSSVVDKIHDYAAYEFGDRETRY